MNSELNPAKYRLQGRRLKVAQWIDRLSGGGLGWQQKQEAAMERMARKGLREELASCALIVSRDPESKRELIRSGVPGDRIIVGADSALIQETSAWPPEALHPELVRCLSTTDKQRIGLCISAQRHITRRVALVEALDTLLEDPGIELVGLAMNPITDLALLQDLRRGVRRKDAFLLPEGIREPGDMTALAAQMDLLISSRLHLLILGSIHHVPLIGISRGSKVDNFLSPFDLQAVGSVESCDFAALIAEARRLLTGREAFAEKSHAVRSQLLDRLDQARDRLAETLHHSKTSDQ